MASLRQSPGGTFFVTFRYQGQRFERSLCTTNPSKARQKKSQVEQTLGHLKRIFQQAPAREPPLSYLLQAVLRSSVSFFLVDTRTPRSTIDVGKAIWAASSNRWTLARGWGMLCNTDRP